MNKTLAVISITLLSPFVHAKTNKSISIYDDTYLMETYTSEINQSVYSEVYGKEMIDLQNVEIKFQFSMAVPLAQMGDAAIMASYTQLSMWQLGNTSESSPFRETNYKPQLFVMHQGKYGIFNNIEYGYRHESNGGEINITRSWDRLFLSAERVNDRIGYGVQGWYILDDDENSNISDYIPSYELWLSYQTSIGTFKSRGAYNFSTDNGFVETSYSLPLSQFVDLYVQIWEGYGETLIDYNHNQTRIGVGIKLNSDLIMK